MSAIAAKTSYTPEDLLAMPDEKNYELVGGQLVERKMGSYSSWVGGELLFLLRLFCQANPIGWVFPADNGFQCFPRMPGKVLKPDVSFVRLDRLAGVAPLRGYLRIPPDLAVEVTSPNDLAWEIDEKVADYLKAGVPLVWVVHPVARAVTVHRALGPVSWLREEEELSGEEILPGFRCQVAAIFPRREELETEQDHP